MYTSRPIYDLLVSVPFPPVRPSLLAWKSGVSPLSTLPEVVATIATYLVVCFGGQWLMRDRKAFSKELFSRRVELFSVHLSGFTASERASSS